jgi:hypothetical protein
MDVKGGEFLFVGMREKVPRGRFGDGKLWGSAGMGMENVGICGDGDGERKLPEAGNGDKDGEHFKWQRMEWKSTPHSRPALLTSLG